MGAETWNRNMGGWERDIDEGEKEKPETPNDEPPDDAEIRDLPEIGKIPLIPDMPNDQQQDEEAIIREEILKRINSGKPIKPGDSGGVKIDELDIN